jgi:hypothetical protein
LSSERLDAAIDEIQACRRRTDMGRSVACDAIHAAVRGSEDKDAARHAAINVKRALFSDRLPNPDDFEKANAILGPASADLVTDQIARLSDLQAAEHTLSTELKAETRRSREIVADFARSEEAMLAAAMTNPGLLQGMQRLAQSDSAAPTKKERQVGPAVFKAMIRSTTRSTPLSRFAVAAAAVIVSDPRGDVEPHLNLAGSAECAAVILNPVVLRRFAQALESRPEISRYLPARLNPGLTATADEVLWLVLKPDPASRDWLVSKMCQRWSRTPRTRVVAAVLAAAETVFVPRAVLVRRVLRKLGLGEERGAEIQSVFRKLVSAGLLEARLDMPDLEASPERLAAALEACGVPEAWSWAAAVRELGELAVAAGTRRVDERVKAQSVLKDRLVQMAAELGVSLAGLDRLLLFEDVSPTVEPLNVPRQSFPEDGLAFAALHDIACAYDPGIIMQEAVRSLLLEEGRAARLSVPDLLLRLTAASGRWQRRTSARLKGGSATTLDLSFPGLDTPRLRILREVQTALFQEVSEAARGAKGGVCMLDPARIMDLLAPLPDPAPRGGAVAVFGVPLSGREGPLLAVRSVFAGFGKTLSRFTGLLSRGGEAGPAEAVRAWIADVIGDDVIVADIGTSFGHAGSTRRPLAPFELDLPGTVPRLPPEQRVPLGDLIITLCENGVRPVLRRISDDQEVVCLDLGFLHGLAYPQLVQVLTQIAPLSSGPYLELLLDGIGAVQEGASSIPEIRLGPLILKPRSWWMAADALPRPLEGRLSAKWVMDIRAWREQHGLPARMILRQHTALDWLAARADGGHEGNTQAEQHVARSRYPIFLDLTAPLGLALLAETLARSPVYLLFEEPLHLAWSQHFHLNGRRHAAEIVLEVGVPPHSRRK